MDSSRTVILVGINLWRLVPGSILSVAVDVGAVLHQVAYDPQPATGAGLMQGAVPGVVPVVNVTDPSLQTVQHHLLDTRRHVDSQ